MPRVAPTSFALAALFAAQSAFSQDIAPQAVTLIEGVAFAGEGGVELQPTDDGAKFVARFWRPLQFTKDEQVIAGRMECRAAAEHAPMRANWADLEAIYRAEDQQGTLGNFSEIDTRTQASDLMSRFDVSGRRRDPLRYEVRTYIAVRTASQLVQIRETCQFLRDGQIARQNFFDYVDRHTSFVLALAPPDSENPSAATTLDTLTEVAS